MAVSFADLPTEIVVQIFKRAIRDGSHGLHHMTNIVRVCQYWNQLGTPLLWYDIKFDERSLSEFVNGPIVPSKLGLIECLTISLNEARLIPGVEADKSVRNFFKRNISLFRVKLEYMKNLSTFSLDLADISLPAFDNQLWLTYSTLSGLLRVLPQTVQSLEIDTRGYETSSLDPTCCLCQDIAYVLPHLKHLKLGLSTMCSELFVESSNMESIIINLAADHEGITRRCGGPRHPWPIWGLGCSPESAEIRSTLLTIPSFHLFPNLTQFLIIDLCTYFDVILKHDLILQNTTSYPIMHKKLVIWLKMGATTVVRVADGPYRTCIDFAGTTKEIVTLLTDHAWHEDHRGVRYPKARRYERTRLPIQWKADVVPNYCSRYKGPVRPTIRADALRVISVLNMERFAQQTLIRPRVQALGEVLEHLPDELDDSGEE